jgi:hypothetical protein
MLKQVAQFRGLFWMLVFIALFNTVDFFATQDLVVLGEHKEWNPLMRGLVGTPSFALYKLILIPIGLLFLWLVRRFVVPKYMGLVRLACGIYAFLMVYTWVVFYA